MDSSKDEALSWDAGNDPTLDDGVSASAAAPEPVVDDAVEADPFALPDGYAAVGKGSDEVGRIDAQGAVTMPGDRQPMGNASLIALGVLGGVYVLYAIGWLIGGLRLQGAAQFLVSPAGYTASLVVAVAAPLIWYLTSVVLTRASAPWVRFTWLAAGVILLVPWPFVMVGAVGV